MAHMNRFKVVIIPSDEGIAVGCPALLGCWSQGESEAEALENIADAIREYLTAIDERQREGETREVDVAV